MIAIEEYLARLAALDIKLWVDDGKLRCNAPQNALTPELQAELAARKPELLDFLSRSAGSDTDFSIKPFPRDKAIPLTQGQERIWSLAKMEPGSSVYNVPTVFRLSGALDVSALERALTEIQRRHEALRTVFPGDDVSLARQEIRPPSAFVLPVTPVGRDLAKLPPEQAKRAIRRLLQSEVRQAFDLENGPLWRARLFRLGPGESLLAFTMHHIVFDGMSKTIFLDELAEAYKATASGDAFAPAPLTVQFADYAAWQRERLDETALSRQLAYWKDRLAGDVPALATPNERPRIAGKGRAGSVHFNFPDALTQGLVELSRREQASLFIVLLTAFNVLLNRHTGQEDLVVCAPMASREHADIEKLIGYFNNIVVIRTDLSANPAFRTLVAQLRRLSVEAFDNQYVPLQHLAQLPNLVRTPLTRAMFSYQEASSRHLALPGIKARPMSVRKDAADFDLAVYVERDGEKLGGVLDYNADIFSAQMIKRLLQRFGQILDLALASPDRLLKDFPAYGKKPGNIEALLVKHPQIDAAVVVLEPRSGTLHAYLVLNEHDVPSLDAVRAYAAASLPDYKVPASFIPVDEMPLQPDGSVDLAALPPPGVGRSRLATTYVGPRTELEHKLAEIWKKVLWLDHEVGIHDRFRDLGGHSLLSVQLVVEIEKALQRRVSGKALAKLNTVAELAVALEAPEPDSAGKNEPTGSSSPGRLPPDVYHGLRSHTASWEGKRTTPDSVMVGLNTEGPRQILFWCLQRYQELTQLAKYLGPEQPVYGLRSGNRVMVKTRDNINLLAAHYVDEILATQPAGPYLIGGNCQAAQIAFQVASQLTALGHEITLLVLQEKFVPFPYHGPVALLFGDKSDYNPMRYFRQPEVGWRKYYTGPLAMSVVSGAHGQFFREPNVQVLTDAIRSRIRQAQAGDFAGWTIGSSAQGFQRLPEEAYRAQIAGPSEFLAIAGQTFTVSVEVRNISACTWRSTEESGIYLANRWMDSEGRVVRWLDGSIKLPHALEPEASVKLDLSVQAPENPGVWTLDLDLVDEGVTWFQDQSSAPLRIKGTVQKP